MGFFCHHLIIFSPLCRILAQSQTDRFPPDWNAWGGRLDEDDSDVSKDDSGHPKPRSFSTPNIPHHILSAPLDCPKIAPNQTSLRECS